MMSFAPPQMRSPVPPGPAFRRVRWMTARCTCGRDWHVSSDGRHAVLADLPTANPRLDREGRFACLCGEALQLAVKGRVAQPKS